MPPSEERTAEQPPGHRLFAQYAHAPNALGYCGPTGSAALVAAVAQRFSGAWPYQRLLATMAGVDDPLDAAVVRGYWTGNALSDAVDRSEFGERLIAELATQAGHYWTHLNHELLPEAAPNHAFHVLGVYPWSRLLGVGPEPLGVLESCRIGWALVEEVLTDELVVTGPQLEYDAGTDVAPAVLRLGQPATRRIGYRLDGRPFVEGLVPGDTVAVHWDFACDRLSADQATALTVQTTHQLTAMAPRVADQR